MTDNNWRSEQRNVKNFINKARKKRTEKQNTKKNSKLKTEN